MISEKKIKHNSPRGALFRKTIVKTQTLEDVITEEILVAASAAKLEDSEDLERIINNLNGRSRTKVHIGHDNSHMKYFRNRKSNSFFQPQSSFQPQNQTIQNQNFGNQNSQPQNSIFQPKPPFEVFTQDPNYMPYKQWTRITCRKCGYLNHLATNCTVRRNPPCREAQNPFNQNSKN